MITIPLSPEQYQQALAHIMAVPQSNDLLSYELPTADHPGQLVTSQISLEFTYNGSNALSVNILEKRGLARFASESTIQSHLVDLLGKLS